MGWDAGVVDAKRSLRSTLLAQRRALPVGTIAAASRSIVAALRTLPELADESAAARTGGRDGYRPGGPLGVLLYAADPDEVDLDPLILGPPSTWRVLLPRVVDGEVVPVAHRPDEPLTPGYRGIREPVGEPVEPASVHAVIVPGVSFGPDGTRLGRGAGLYDRLLPRLTGAVRIGVCLEPFIRADLPREPHDAVMDLVITDASVRRRADAGDARPA